MITWILSLYLFFFVMSLWTNGRIYTEAKAEGEGAAFYLTRFGIWSLVLLFFLVLSILASPALLWFNLFSAPTVSMLLLGFGWWIVIGTGLTVLTGLVANWITLSYYKAKFGGSRPDYNNWPEFDKASDQESGDVVIRSGNWGPVFRSSSKPSLKARTSSRSRAASSSSGTHRVSSSLGGTNRAAFIPLPIGDASRVSMPKLSGRNRVKIGGSKSKGGSGLAKLIALLAAAMARLIQFLIALLIWLFYIAIALLLAFIAYKGVFLAVDFFDETYTLEHLE